ncbi:sensor histidine kinase [Streptomyces sp. NPDC059063]|uniref:sensor histidine kinase n=1 Tax=unclassified Streptomyces TaxID=2593676 RepID=UPI0036864E3D
MSTTEPRALTAAEPSALNTTEPHAVTAAEPSALTAASPRAPRAAAWTWTRNDGLVAVGATALDLFSYSVSGELDSHPVTVPGIALVTASTLALLFRRRHPVLTIVAALALIAALRLTEPVSNGFNAALVVALFTVARTRSLAVAVPAGLASVALPLLNSARDPLSHWDTLGNLAAAALVIGAATVLNRWQRDVEANRRLLADRAVAEERRRIARELHDIVSHHITTMQLMAGGARANLAHNPDVSRDALITLEDSGRMALREMRQLLDVLRADDEPDDAPPSPQPGVADLDRIVAESCRAGLPTELSVLGQERPLPPTVSLTVFRIVQEALTNARKYAAGARARVRLTYLPDELVVEVRDDGAGTLTAVGAAGASRSGSGGYGLIGMRERVAVHGGSLSAGPLDEGGFGVTASLPLAPGEGEDLLR